MSSRADALYYMRKNLDDDIRFKVKDSILEVVTDYPLDIKFSIENSRASGGIDYKYLIVLSYMIDVSKSLVIRSFQDLVDHVDKNLDITGCFWMLYDADKGRKNAK